MSQSGLALSNQWTLGSFVGKGACGEVYEVLTEQGRLDRHYVAKIISLGIGLKGKGLKEQSRTANTLFHEYTLLSGHLATFPYTPARPQLPFRFYGEGAGYRFLIMEKLDEDLSAFAKRVPRPSNREVAEIGIQLLSGFQDLHGRGCIFIDVKLENFMLKKSEGFKIFFIDFGIAGRFISHVVSGQKGDEMSKGFEGNRLYGSIKKDEGYTSAYRDDIESVGYLLLALASGGELPWSEEPNETKLIAAKARCDISRVCQEKGCPEIAEIILHCRGVPFSQRPDYAYCIRLLEKMKSSQPASVSSSSASKSNRICRTERKEEISIQSSAQSPSSDPSDPLTAPSKKGKKAVEGKKIAKETTVTVKDSCSDSVSIAAVQTFEVSTVQKASSGTPSIRDRRAKPFGNSAAVLQTGCSEVRHLERVSSNGPFGSSCNDLAEVVHEKNKSTAKGKKAKAVIDLTTESSSLWTESSVEVGSKSSTKRERLTAEKTSEGPFGSSYNARTARVKENSINSVPSTLTSPALHTLVEADSILSPLAENFSSGVRTRRSSISEASSSFSPSPISSPLRSSKKSKASDSLAFTCLLGPHSKQIFSLPIPFVGSEITFTIGRSPPADICLDRDQLVSEKHAKLKVLKSKTKSGLDVLNVKIWDDRSTNGTKVNSRKLVANRWTDLNKADCILVGESVLSLL